MTDEVLVDSRGPVTEIRLNRPAKRNAITTAMYDMLTSAIESVDVLRNPFILLTGSGGSFTAGNDLADMKVNPPLGNVLRRFAFSTRCHRRRPS